MRVALLSVVIILSAPALANGNASPSAAAQEIGAATAPAKETKKVCRRMEATESRLGAKKLCLTAEQWKQRSRGTEFPD